MANLVKKILLSIICTVALLFGVTFTVKNAQVVELSYYFGIDWQGPLSWLIILVLLFGMLLGMLICFFTAFKKKLFSGRDKSRQQIEPS